MDRLHLGKVISEKKPEPVAISTYACSFCGGPAKEVRLFSLDRKALICEHCTKRFSIMANIGRLSGMDDAPPERWKGIFDTIQASMARDLAPSPIKASVSFLTLDLCKRSANLLANKREGNANRFVLVLPSDPGYSLVDTAKELRTAAQSVGINVMINSLSQQSSFDALYALCLTDPKMVEHALVVNLDSSLPDNDWPCAMAWICRPGEAFPKGARVRLVLPGDQTESN